MNNYNEFYEDSDEKKELVKKFEYKGHLNYDQHITNVEIGFLQNIIGLEIPRIYCPDYIFTWDHTPRFSSPHFWLELSKQGRFERTGQYLVINNEHMETTIGNSYYPLKISLLEHRFSWYGNPQEKMYGPSEIIISGEGKITKIQIWETFFDFKDNTGGSESVICDSALLFFREDGKRFAIKASGDSGSSTELCCSSEEIEEYFFSDDSAKERRLHKKIE